MIVDFPFRMTGSHTTSRSDPVETRPPHWWGHRHCRKAGKGRLAAKGLGQDTIAVLLDLVRELVRHAEQALGSAKGQGIVRLQGHKHPRLPLT